MLAPNGSEMIWARELAKIKMPNSIWNKGKLGGLWMEKGNAADGFAELSEPTERISSRVMMWRLFAKTWSFGCRLVCRPYDYMVVYSIYIVIYSTYYNLTDVFATLRWFFWESYSDGIQLDLAVQRFAPFVEVRRCKSRHCRLQLCLPGHVFFISTKSRPGEICFARPSLPFLPREWRPCDRCFDFLWHLAHPKSSR